MYKVKIGNWNYLPLDFLNFHELLEVYKGSLVFTRGFSLTEELVSEINHFAEKNTNEFIALDMENIGEVPDRLNLKLLPSNENVIFFNVKNDVIKDDLKKMYTKGLFWHDSETAYFGELARDSFVKMHDSTKTYRNMEQDKIVRSLVMELDEPEKLASSGLFCNCYVNIKSLFSNTLGFQYTIFNMASTLRKDISDVDAFITSSRNGAILASVLGGLLNIKEVHLIGIGPMYAARLGDTVDCIRKGKHYVYIFDFMCTGTEMKITSSLINSKKAFLENSIGIARVYKQDDDEGMFNGKIKVLTDTKRAGIDYRIAATRDDLKALTEKK